MRRRVTTGKHHRDYPLVAQLLSPRLLLLFLLWALILWHLTSFARGQDCVGGQCQPPTGNVRVVDEGPPVADGTPMTTPSESVVLVAYDYGSGSSGRTSGTVIDRVDGKAVVISCWHGLNPAPKRITIQAKGRWHEAVTLAVDQDADLALLAIADPGLPAVAIAETHAAIGDELAVVGYLGTTTQAYARVRARGYAASGPTKADVLVSAGSARGCSGAAVLNRKGELCAVAWGGTRTETHAACLPRIRRLLGRVFGARPTAPRQFPRGAPPAALPTPDTRPSFGLPPSRGADGSASRGSRLVPVVPDEVSQREPPAQPSAAQPECAIARTALPAMQEQLVRIEAALLDLQSRPAERGPQGEQGPQGEIGPIGPQGPKGDKGDPAEPLNLAALPPMRVQIVSKDGKLLQEQSIPIGGLLKFRLVPAPQTK